MKILYVSTISNTINAFMVPHIEMLLDKGNHVDIACNVHREIDIRLLERGCKVFNLDFNRSPLKMSNYKAYKKLRKLIIDEKYDLVHTHTPVASAIARLACRNIKKIKVFYTAHGFHFYKGAPLKNWMIYYPIERWLSRYTDILITINKEDYERAKNFLKAGRVEYMPGVGLDIKKIRDVIIDKKNKRRELGLSENLFILLSVGELNKNKNHETVIRALDKINNPEIHYVICGRGPLENYLRNLAEELKLEKQVHLLGYREDIVEICKASDVFVFPSKREGLGMAALEAMACGLPIVTSNVHGILDYSIDGITGYVSDPNNIDKFMENILNLYSKSYIKEKIGRSNQHLVKKYDIKNSIKCLECIYVQ